MNFLSFPIPDAGLGLRRFACLLGVLTLGPEALATKATAPFDIETHFAGNHVTVSVRAQSEARDVVVDISGSDGLVVAGGTLHGTVQVKEFRRESVTAGEVLTFEIDFTASDAHSMLAVSVDCAGEPALVRGFYPPAAATPAPAAAVRVVAPLASSPGKVSWPIHADAQFDPASGHAHVTVTTSRPGTDVVVKVYGLDGLVVSGGVPEGSLIVKTERRASLKPGESFEFDVAVRPGEGQSYLVVSAQGKGIGSDLRNLSLGELSEAQKRERQRGVTVDPEGHPIKILNP